MILKPNMVLPGLAAKIQITIDEAARATVKCLRESVPAAIPGIAFLSGGQTPELSTLRLNAMNEIFRGSLPWELTFSYSRAIQGPALKIWMGQAKNTRAAQESLLYRAKCNSEAREGNFKPNVQAK
jgi:fructose-bisphosphate aldolase class I